MTRECIYLQELGCSPWLLMQIPGSLGDPCSVLYLLWPSQWLSKLPTIHSERGSFLVLNSWPLAEKRHRLQRIPMWVQAASPVFLWGKFHPTSCPPSMRDLSWGIPQGSLLEGSVPEGVCLASIYSRNPFNPFLPHKISWKLLSVLDGNSENKQKQT